MRKEKATFNFCKREANEVSDLLLIRMIFITFASFRALAQRLK